MKEPTIEEKLTAEVSRLTRDLADAQAEGKRLRGWFSWLGQRNGLVPFMRDNKAGEFVERALAGEPAPIGAKCARRVDAS